MLELRDYQETLLTQASAAFRDGARAPLVVSPTGSGKTVVLAHATRLAAMRGWSVGILTHREEILEQTSNKLRDVGLEHACIASGRPFDPRAPVQVCSVQTLARRLDRAPDLRLIVVDEAHHAVAGQWARILQRYPDAHRIGFTATPERLDGRGMGDVFDRLVLGPSVQWMIDHGHLVDPTVYAPPGPNLTGARTAMGDWDRRDLEKAMLATHLVGDAVAHYARICPGQPAAAFCVSVAHARALAEAFQAAGFRAVALSGDTPRDERRAALAGLATGETQVVCSVDIISEGTDVPALTAAIMCRPTQSRALYIQSAGRVLRPAPGKTAAYIIDHAGNTQRHGAIWAERQWSLDAPRRKRSDVSPSAVRTCPECYRAHNPAPACPGCGHVYPANARLPDEKSGDLVELDRQALEALHKARQKLAYSARTPAEIRAYGREAGYKPGWAEIRIQQLRKLGRLVS
jgi:DNA repair protein RadD